MAIDKIQSESINLADNFAFTGTVTGAGESNAPSFLVTGGNSNQTVPNNAYTKVEYNQEVFDTANAFSSNRFTVPSGQAGKYFFSAQLFFEDSDNQGKRLILEFKKNNSGIKYNQIRVNDNASQVICFPAIITTLDDASVGDYYEVFMYHETFNNSSVLLENASTSYANNFFSGFKVSS
ncbi:c1q globular head like domain containing protein [uncultured Mediterranean phage uvMED]|nr:c1q globular head like domain containing protein [uncultured Mediterranean phage uvMED]